MELHEEVAMATKCMRDTAKLFPENVIKISTMHTNIVYEDGSIKLLEFNAEKCKSKNQSNVDWLDTIGMFWGGFTVGLMLSLILYRICGG